MTLGDLQNHAPANVFKWDFSCSWQDFNWHILSAIVELLVQGGSESMSCLHHLTGRRLILLHQGLDHMKHTPRLSSHTKCCCSLMHYAVSHCQTNIPVHKCSMCAFIFLPTDLCFGWHVLGFSFHFINTVYLWVQILAVSVLINFLFLFTVCCWRSTTDQQQKNWSLISMAAVLLVVWPFSVTSLLDIQKGPHFYIQTFVAPLVCFVAFISFSLLVSSCASLQTLLAYLNMNNHCFGCWRELSKFRGCSTTKRG